MTPARLALGRRDAALAALVAALDDKRTAPARLAWLRAEVVRTEAELAAALQSAVVLPAGVIRPAAKP